MSVVDESFHTGINDHRNIWSKYKKYILQLRSHISLLLVIYIVALFETLTFYYRMELNDFE